MPEDLEARFWALAEAQAAGFGFADNCEAMMRQFIAQGVQKLISEGSAGNEFKVHQAEANLSRFIDAMTYTAVRLHLDQLHEQTFGAAITSLCPLWPFC
jgi:hypothetical protein